MRRLPTTGGYGLSLELSYVIVSWNRRDRLLETLGLLPEHTRLPKAAWEAIVVDNASKDGSAAAVREAFPGATVLRRPSNEGVSARNHGFAIARGRYVMIIDDDSYPDPGVAPRMIRYLDEHPRTAALSGRIVLPDGRLEAAALPTVLLGGATCLRASALREIGGFCTDFFRQAEEWDLSLRMWGRGYRVERYEDLVFRHQKVAGGRSTSLNARLDMRNNLVLLMRHLPRRARIAYRHDWLLRYGALARHAGHAWASRLGRWAARARSPAEMLAGRQPLDGEAFEQVFQWQRQQQAVARWAKRRSVKRVAIADFGKNVFATHRACLRAGLEVACLLDDHPAYDGLRYRGLPILPMHAVPAVDGVVVSNVNPAQMESRTRRTRQVFGGPVLSLWRPRQLSSGTGPTLASVARLTSKFTALTSNPWRLRALGRR